MHKNMQGFSMVEFAIVMVIIGLLVGGAVAGRSMLYNARINGTIQQILRYDAATTMFKDTYEELPGDLDTALGRLPGCTAATACANGDANGLVGVAALGFGNVDATLASENTQFWKHLAAASLINEVNAGATSSAFGESHPASEYTGGYFVRQGSDAGASLPNGLLYVLRGAIDGRWLEESLSPAIAPNAAAIIDRKMDDGFAFTGRVWSISSAYNNGCGIANAGGQGPTGYDEDSTIPTCDMLIKVKLK